MAETTKAAITKDWSKIADGQCEVQSVDDRDAFGKTYFDMVIGASQPASDTDTFMRITLAEHANFHRESPVWLRLNADSTKDSQTIIVIK